MHLSLIGNLILLNLREDSLTKAQKIEELLVNSLCINFKVLDKRLPNKLKFKLIGVYNFEKILKTIV